MNRTLLCILCFLTFSFVAKADEMVVKFGPANRYETNGGTITNKVEFDEVKDNVNADVFNLPDLGSFTIGVKEGAEPTKTCNISAGGSGGNAHMAMFLNYILKFKFNEGVTVTKMVLTAPTKTYTVDLTPSTGTCTADKDTKTVTWAGSATGSLDLEVSGGNQLRIMYIEITYTKGGTTGIAEVAVDNNTPVEYFNLQGVRVVKPENGIYIRRQGTDVQKVIVK